jgi:SNF2 family DNA or RNA helicase
VYHQRPGLSDHDLVLTTYQVAARDVELPQSLDRIVLDEAQR